MYNSLKKNHLIKLTMKVFFGVLFVAVAALALEETSNPVYGYHKREGIPKYNYIKKLEENAQASRIVGGVTTDISQVPYQVSQNLYF